MTFRLDDFPANLTQLSKRYRNCVYVGRARWGDYRFYYIGQAIDPAQRWVQHLNNRSGPCQFGNPSWAILVHNIPSDRLGTSESYFIGYFLARFNCVNCNKGNDSAAFLQGYLDGAQRKPPMLCEDFDPDNLDWQSFHETTGCLVGGNFIRPHDPLALDLRYWGIHAADEQLVALAVAGCKKRLEGREENIRQEQRRLEESASFLRLKYICIGATLGAIASLFGQWILTP